MTPVRLKPAAPRSRFKHSTTEPLRSQSLVGKELITKLLISLCVHARPIVFLFTALQVYLIAVFAMFQVLIVSAA